MLGRFFTLVAAILVGAPAWAVPPDPTLLSARSLGMGGALRSLATSVDAPRLNPAAVAPERGFFAGASYATRREGAFDGGCLTLIDNVTSPIGGAIQYLRMQGDRTEREDMGLSFAVGRHGLWWGFTLRYVQGRERGDSQWEDVVTADVGFLFERPSGTRFSVVGTNLLETSLDILDRHIAVGVAQVDFHGWDLAADLVRNLREDISNGLDLHLGAEYRLPWDGWRARLGQMWRGETGKDYASVGFGWNGSFLRLGYAVQKARQRSDEFLHVFSLEGLL